MHKECTKHHRSKFTDTKSQQKYKQNRQELVDTHTRKRMSPPIMITITKACMFSFQPQKREKLYFLNKDQRSNHPIFEDTIITFLPNYSNNSKPYDLKEQVRTTRHPCHERNLNAMIT
jgi:hypothetical protein